MTKKAVQDDRHVLRSGGWSARLIADEPAYDRRMLWRIGSWGSSGIAALVMTIYVAQSPLGMARHELDARADATLRQQERLQKQMADGQTELRRLAAAVDVLNGDRDRVFARMTSLEQGVETITGSIERKPGETPGAGTPEAKSAQPATSAQPVASAQSLPAELLSAVPMPQTAAVAPAATPDPRDVKTVRIETGGESAQPSVPPAAPATGASAAISVQPSIPAEAAKSDGPPPADKLADRTQFGVALGGAGSVGGLRTLWSRLLKANGETLGNLLPIIAIHENPSGRGVQLRLIAGPLADAAAASRICAAMLARDKNGDCETAIFDGQRLPAAQPKTSRPSEPARPKETRSRAQAERSILPFPLN
jgi:hypothetical protein